MNKGTKQIDLPNVVGKLLISHQILINTREVIVLLDAHFLLMEPQTSTAFTSHVSRSVLLQAFILTEQEFPT